MVSAMTVTNYDVLQALFSGNAKWLGNGNEHPCISWHNVTPTRVVMQCYTVVND